MANGPRRRRRATAAQGPPPEHAAPAPSTSEAAPKKRAAHRDTSERGLRDIVGAGPSALSESAALRARELNRPTDEDLAEAERTVVIVRRNWKPPS